MMGPHLWWDEHFSFRIFCIKIYVFCFLENVMKNETSLLKVHTFFVKIFAKICCPISKPLCPIIFLIFLFVLSRLFYAETTVSQNETSNQDTSKTRMSNGFVKKKSKSNPNKDCTAVYATLLNLRRFYSMHYCTTCTISQYSIVCLTY